MAKNTEERQRCVLLQCLSGGEGNPPKGEANTLQPLSSFFRATDTDTVSMTEAYHVSKSNPLRQLSSVSVNINPPLPFPRDTANSHVNARNVQPKDKR